MDAKVESFFKNGTDDINLEDCDEDCEEPVPDVAGAGCGEDEVGDNAYRTSLEKFGDGIPESGLDKPMSVDLFISPKCFSVSFNASSWPTPAKATTILSG